jgi:methylase of polypeptide subunit release factors
VHTKLLPTNVLHGQAHAAGLSGGSQSAICARVLYGRALRPGTRQQGALQFHAVLHVRRPHRQLSPRRGGVRGHTRPVAARGGPGWRDIKSCLEIGCGYGRIVRELRREIPPSCISVSDIIDEGARFTAAEFGVRRVPVVEAMGSEYDGSFDLI